MSSELNTSRTLLQRRRRPLEAAAWVAAIGASSLFALALYSVAGQGFTTTIDDPLALPKELVITSNNADIPLPPELTEEAQAAQAETQTTVAGQPSDVTQPQSNDGDSDVSTSVSNSSTPSSSQTPPASGTANNSANSAPTQPAPTQPSSPAPTAPQTTSPPETAPPTSASAPNNEVREEDNGPVIFPNQLFNSGALGRVVDGPTQ